MRRSLVAAGVAVFASVAWPDLAETHLPWAAILLGLVALDFGLALLATVHGGGRVQFVRLPRTAYKLAGYYGVIVLVHLMGAYRPEAWGLITPCYLYFCTVEGISILGHAGQLGVIVPASVRAWFEGQAAEHAGGKSP